MHRKMNAWEYYVGHCWRTGWQSIRGSFRIWRDLLSDNYADYALMWYDDPRTECLGWFWDTLGEDDTLPRDFLDTLYEMSDRVKRGEEKLVPFDRNMIEQMCELAGGCDGGDD